MCQEKKREKECTNVVFRISAATAVQPSFHPWTRDCSMMIESVRLKAPFITSSTSSSVRFFFSSSLFRMHS